MKTSDILLAILILLFLALAFWAFSTGRFDAVAGSFIDQAWNSIQGLLRPIFRR
jgi:hypothetical protein